MKTIETCPICNHQEFEFYIQVKDFLVTRNKFKIVKCKNCGFHFTNPRPYLDKIGDYYKSTNYISHNPNSKGLISIFYNFVREINLKNKIGWIKHETIGRDLLDIGSGTGDFLRVANENGFNGIGLEPNESAREYAHKINSVRSSPQEELYNIEERSFDIITMWHVLEHVYELRKDLEHISKILKNDGKLFIAVPNMNSYDAQHYKSYWAAYDLPRHLYHFTKNDISRLMLDFGFELKKIIPLKYDAYYISMLSEKHRTFLPFLGIFQGFISNLKADKNGYSSQLYVFAKS